MKRVFILDDDKNLCTILRELMLTLGASECHFALSLQELMEKKSEALLSDLLLLDVNLGNNSPTGLDAYEWILGEKYQGQIVFMTGHARSHPLVQKSLKLSKVLIWEKPFPLSLVEEILK